MNEAESQEKSSKFSDIGEILGILRKRRGIIIWTTIICAVLTFFTSVFLISPKYSSNTDILVNRKVNNQENAQAQIQADVQMISTYKDIITSPTILNTVSDQLSTRGYNMNAADIKNCINISNQQNSQVFTVTVETKNPNLSALIANTVADVFKKKVKTIMSVNNVSILSKAVANSNPVSPKIPLATLAGIVAGLLLGLILAFAIDGLDRTVDNESFITKELGLNDLGIINEIPANKVKKMLMTSHSAKGSRRKRRV